MYGLAFEFIYQFVNGTHIHFLSRTPSPKIIADAFATVKPDLIITVPLVIEKIIKKKVFPTIEKPHMKLLMNIPIINDKIRESIRQKGHRRLRRKIQRINHRRSSPEQGSRALSPLDSFSLHGGIRHDRMWSSAHLRQLENFPSELLWQGSASCRTSDRLRRSPTYRRGKSWLKGFV